MSVRVAAAVNVSSHPPAVGGRVRRSDSAEILVSSRPSSSICMPLPSTLTSEYVALARNLVSVE